MKKKVILERVYKAGYVVRDELVDMEIPGTKPLRIKSAYNPRGEYIGNPRTAYRLCVKRGIQPELADANDSICTVGFSIKDGKWYGWSHRAIFGFKVGSKCKKGNCHYVARRHHGKGEWTARTVSDARRMACDFAESVS